MNQAATSYALAPMSGAVTPKVASRVAFSPLAVALFLLAHIPLALLIRKFSPLALLHSLGAFGLGLLWAADGRHRHRVAWVAAYIASAEVLWRMTGGLIIWEFAKYAISGLFLFSMLRQGRLRLPPVPMIYFLLLLPACLPTLTDFEFDSARRDISFNLSGPFALMVSVLFFSGLRLTPSQVLNLLVALIAPLVAVATIALSGTFRSAIFFGASSNLAASGGFGPNQVSSAMGLGVVVAFLCLMDERVHRGLKLLLFAIILAFAGQSALTLSRSGLYIAVICVAAACLFLARTPRLRVPLLGGGLLLVMAFIFLVFPRLDAFTGGAMSARFKNTNPTGRDSIIKADLQIWVEHPVWGAGVGVAQVERAKYYRLIGSHNELTRLLAEHGLLGFFALLLLLYMGWWNFRRARTAKWKALVTALICFSFLFMLANGMRLALVSFTFGLAGVGLWLGMPRTVPRREIPGAMPARPAPTAP